MKTKHIDEEAEQEADLYLRWCEYQQRYKILYGTDTPMTYLEWKFEEKFDE